MSIKKQYLKTKPVCKVTFLYPSVQSNGKSKVQLLGDFNGWDQKSTPLRKNKEGIYAKTVELNTGNEYEFKYLVNGEVWENDPQAEGFVKNTFATENSVVFV